MNSFVITRLHARYSKDSLGDDLFFRPATPIVGGREFLQDGHKLEQGARPDSQNNFQARYIIRHPWTGPIACAHPQRGMWGGPPNGPLPPVDAASKIGFVARGAPLALASFVRGAIPPESFLSHGGSTPLLAIPPALPDAVDASVPEAGGLVVDASPEQPLPDAGAPMPPATPPPEGGCAGCTTARGDAGSAAAVAALIGIALTRLRRRRG
jgi:hypothetical protein